MEIYVAFWSKVTQWIFGTMFPLHHDENGAMETSHKREETQSSDIDSWQLPVAKPIFYDFPSYDRIGWVVTSNGYFYPIPYATAAKIDAPDGFPEIPERWDVLVLESADGLYEVVNVLEALNPTPEVEKGYREALKKMESRFKELYNNTSLEGNLTNTGACPPTGPLDIHRERRKSIMQICEDTAYEIEALVGAMQVFGEIQLDDVHGVDRIGVFFTFSCYSFDQNYNLNLVMTRWIRKYWIFPYADGNEVKRLALKYGFEPLAIETWLANARAIVWQPLLKLVDIVGREAPATHKDASFKTRFCEDRTILSQHLPPRRSPSY
jgi:hypothetical protein